MSQYEVLSPWAEAEPKPLRGITPRVTDLTGKRIGLFVNYKRAARPILTVVSDRLKKRFPTVEFSDFVFRENYDVAQTPDKERFEEWLKGVDTVIAAVGD
ncbi:MAG: hypothetical protein HY667_01055 [Chloroflexi bacterium]|nr:hypothetical protein [Chloroflexota bacterium]